MKTENREYMLAVVVLFLIYIVISTSIPNLDSFIWNVLGCDSQSSSCSKFITIIRNYAKLIGFILLVPLIAIVCIKRTRYLGLPIWMGVTPAALFLSDWATHQLSGPYLLISLIFYPQHGPAYASFCGLLFMLWLGTLSQNSVRHIRQVSPRLHRDLRIVAAAATLIPAIEWAVASHYAIKIAVISDSVFGMLALAIILHLISARGTPSEQPQPNAQSEESLPLQIESARRS